MQNILQNQFETFKDKKQNEGKARNANSKNQKNKELHRFKNPTADLTNYKNNQLFEASHINIEQILA